MMIINNRYAELSAKEISQIEFIEMLRQLAEATGKMRAAVEEIDLLLEEAHLFPLAA